MSTVQVQQVLRRYHLKTSERDLQPRLNQLTETILRNQLGSVLTEAGIGSSELVCIKELRVAMNFDENKSDFEISELWRKALLKSVYQQLGRSNQSELIRYPSEIEAIKSLARSLSVGHMTHQWAWRQLGITDGESSDLHRVKKQWLAYLSKHPRLLLPVFKGLMIENTFIKLLERNILRSDELIQLTDVVSKFLHLDINWRGIIEQHGKSKKHTLIHKKAELLSISTPLRNLIRALVQTIQSRSELRFGFAQPMVKTSNNRESETAIIKLLFWAVLLPSGNQLNVTNTTKMAIEAKLLDFWHLVNTEQSSIASSNHGESSVRDNLDEQEQHNVRSESKSNENKEFYSDEELINGDPLDKKSLSCQFGGLLFLLNKLEQENVLMHLQDPRIAHHSISWRLENFCWLLLPECKGDEAVNVFSGRVFDKQGDDDKYVVICDEETQLLTDIADEFKQKIVTSLSLYSRSTKPHKRDLFADMCRRHARIEAQPGWVNIFYELDSVDTAVRAAGLDLNPDYLPWLAYEVKFYYE